MNHRISLQGLAIGLLTLANAAGTASAQGYAKGDSLPASTAQVLVRLPEATIVVGTTSQTVSRKNAPKAAVALSTREVQQSGAAALTDILEGVSGVDVRNRGPFGVQSDISIRGGTFEQTALLVNGMRWSAPHTGHHAMNIPIDPEDLGHVEVVRSGSGALAGVGAFAGSIHLGTAPLNGDQKSSVHLEAGSFGWNRTRLHAQYGNQDLRQQISVSSSGTDGHIENSDARVTRAMWNGRWGSDAHQWQGLVAFEDKAFGAQNFYSSNYPHQYEVTRALVAQVNWETRGAHWKWSKTAYVRRHNDRFELYREGAEWYDLTSEGFYVRNYSSSMAPDTAGLYAPGASWYTGANMHRSLTGAVNSKFEWFIRGHTLTASADVREERIESNRLGALREDVDDSDIYIRSDRRLNADAYVAENWTSASERFSVTGTLGANWNSRFGGRLLPAMDVRYGLGESQYFIVFASAGRSVRHPSFTDLYYNVGGAIGSEDLQPEWADQAEVGWRWTSPVVGTDGFGESAKRPEQLMIEASAFVRRGTNLIDWVRYEQSSVYEATNLSETQFWGWDVSLEYSFYALADDRSVSLRSLRYSSAWTQADRTSADFESSYVLDFLRRKTDISAAWDLPFAVQLDLRASIQERVGGSASGPVSLLGLTARRYWGNKQRMLIAVRLDNLLDLDYVDVGSVYQPGRTWRLSLTFDLDNKTEQ